METEVPGKSNKQAMFQLIEECESSSQSNKSFCKEKDLPEWKYYYWKKKYKEEKYAGGFGDFIRLKPTRNKINSNEVKICYPNGVQVVLSQEIDLSELKAMISLI
jgi:hypothetical protein